MLKIIDLVKRQPGLSVADFQERWSGEAGAALARVPGLLRYVQSHALPQGYARGELLFDGIAEMWFRDEAACAYALTSTAFADAERIAAPTLLADVAPTFTWVRLAARVPVRITLDKVPEGTRLVAGMTCTVAITPATH